MRVCLVFFIVGRLAMPLVRATRNSLTHFVVHIGKRIQLIVRQKNISIVSLAKQLCCSRTNIYKIFEKEAIDTYLLMRISLALDYDFFADLSKCFIEVNEKRT